jgi:hypothetical protein
LPENITRTCPVKGCGKVFSHPTEGQNVSALTLHTIRAHRKVGPGHGPYAAGKPQAKRFGNGSKKWKKDFPPPVTTPDPVLTGKGTPRQSNKDGSVRLGWGQKKRMLGLAPRNTTNWRKARNGRQPVVAETTTLAQAIAALEVKRDSLTEVINDLRRMG